MDKIKSLFHQKEKIKIFFHFSENNLAKYFNEIKKKAIERFCQINCGQAFEFVSYKSSFLDQQTVCKKDHILYLHVHEYDLKKSDESFDNSIRGTKVHQIESEIRKVTEGLFSIYIATKMNKPSEMENEKTESFFRIFVPSPFIGGSIR